MTEAHEPAWPLWLPPLTLASCGVLAGVVPWILNAPLSAAAAAILNTPSDVSLAVWHGLSPALMLSALTLLGVGVAYMARDVDSEPHVAARAWHRAAVHRRARRR